MDHAHLGINYFTLSAAAGLYLFSQCRRRRKPDIQSSDKELAEEDRRSAFGMTEIYPLSTTYYYFTYVHLVRFEIRSCIGSNLGQRRALVHCARIEASRALRSR
jgi:hypothetical protein